MKTAIEKILKSRGRSSEFLAATEFHLRIENEPFMSLTIDRHGATVTVSHYFEQRSDLIPDPDMEFHMLADGSWLPVAIQHATGHYFRAVELTDDGRRLVRPAMLRDLKSFARIWGRNLIAQGFAK